MHISHVSKRVRHQRDELNIYESPGENKSCPIDIVRSGPRTEGGAVNLPLGGKRRISEKENVDRAVASLETDICG